MNRPRASGVLLARDSILVTESSAGGRLKAAFWLTLFVLSGWVLCFYPARLLNGSSGVWWMSLAAISCLVPGWVVVFLSGLSALRNELSAMMVQTMVRLLTVASLAVVLRKFRPELGFRDFYGWLVLFYLLALSVEVVLFRRGLASQRS